MTPTVGWIIPARAGFTPSPFSICRCNRDHPRSRGVYPLPTQEPGGVTGSSPLARGLLLHEPAHRFSDGIIPARAGFTILYHHPLGTVGDHPRSRGVYSPSVTYFHNLAGSSPLARGLHERRPGEGRWRGIIPARAGFTPEGIYDDLRGADHPRSRGVYHVGQLGLSPFQGSSPLARGLPNSGARCRSTLRIIPARAGFTPCATTCGPGRWDHPRSRGVYAAHDGAVVAAAGSSPLARGLPRASGRYGLSSGIIPARAGFTWSCAWARRASGDHPRSRGVYIPVSSPLR